MQGSKYCHSPSWSTFAIGGGPWPAPLENCVSLCCTAGCYENAEISTAITLPGPCSIEWAVHAPEDDLKLLRDVQSFLQCLKHRHTIPRQLHIAWEQFYRVHASLISHTLRGICKTSVLRSTQEDFRQEVWRETLCSLQRLTYCPANGGLEAWLVGLTRRCVFRLLAKPKFECKQPCQAIDDLAESPDLGPEDCCLLSEIMHEQEDLLAKLRARTSDETYEIFHRRHFAGDDVEQVAAAVGLGRDAVYRRYWRAKRVWSDLARDSAVWGQCEAELSQRKGNQQKFF